MLQPAGDYDTLKTRFQWSLPDTYNVAGVVSDAWAASDPQRLAIRHIHTNGTAEDWTHQALNRVANRLANAFRSLGIRPGDRVALLLPQCPPTAIAHLAAYKLGAIAVPLSALFGQDALRYRLSDSGARVLFTDAAGLEKLDEIRDDLPDLEFVVSVDEAGSKDLSFNALAERASDRFETLATTPDDPALMIYTSGTTGQPKGVLHGHRVLIGHMPGIELSQNFLGRSGDLLWTPADWAWAGGLLNALFPALKLGVPVVSFASRKFDPEFAFHLLESQGIRNAFIPPTALKMLRAVDNPAKRFTLNWRSVGSAGESLGRETYDWFAEEFGFHVNEFYGQTECNAVLGSAASLGVTRAGAIGKATPGHDVAIIDDGGNVLPAEALGQIAIRRPDPVMFLEYWNKPEATQEKFIGDWMITGDQGLMDEDGYVHFVGRDDDIITSASYRIGPGEIEDCLIKHPAVALAAVVGKPDPLRTEIVKAYVVLRPDNAESVGLEDNIRGFVRDRLSAHEYPREIEFVEDLPMTTTGKVIRRKLRELARSETV
ncbi:AMP-binding protein [Roseibium album]|uniref:Acetyl-coenzyme A synthetase n=1 Tax=Roseibium album TaxID=311410 RepID=A0A0M7A998_9HYPH|nr:AMP-binding protein [Roseibium album]CTQ58287.1 Acetyl-coenzyme A synthetase [Roseibium album]CTQ66073.1 Acetyl-coenzyme A synthetase [Roseibium album]CTQ71032.1 Acetyl-coenzyme A synthetase [Roseibium album]